MNRQKEQSIASRNEFSLYMGVCVGKGWNDALLMKARDLRAPAKPRCTAGNYWACPSYQHATGLNHCLQTCSSKSWSLIGAELSPDFRQLCCCVSSLLLHYCPAIPKMQHYGSCSHAVWLLGLSSGQNVSCFSARLCWTSSALISKVWVPLVALIFRFSALASCWFGGRESVMHLYASHLRAV